MPHSFSSYRPPAQPLPDAATLPFPGNFIRECSKCSLVNSCTAPVPGDGPAPAEVMLVGQNPGCFPAGTWIHTPDGVRDIASISSGDIVLGAQGQEQRVTRTFQRATNELVQVKIHKLAPMHMTPNHPVLVIRPKRCYDGHTRKYCFPCPRVTCKYRFYADYCSTWMHASDLAEGDHVVLPTLPVQHLDNAASVNNSGILRLPFPQQRLYRKTKYKGSAQVHWSARKGFKLGRGLAYVLGWYMAEGCSNIRNGVIQFSLGLTDSQKLILQQQCEYAFGIKGLWRKRGSARNFVLHSRPLAAWFLALFGNGSHNKRIPAPIFRSDCRVISSFINGWYLGDGKHKRSGRNDGIVTASAEAAFGLQDLLLRLGVVPTMHTENWSGFSGDKSVSGHGFCVEFPPSLKWKRDKQSCIALQNHRLLCVDSVSVVQHECTVFNIETEDNQYLVPFIVHNSNEDRLGKPFIGQAGQYLDSLLFQCGITRESVYTTNLVKCLTANNRPLKPDEIRACSGWLDVEVEVVQPRIIVAMGAPAIARFLGADAGTVEHLHGKPIEKDGHIILPAYHPAAALHNTTLLRQCSEDFQVLRGLLKGANPADYHVVDEYPHPDYRLVDTPAKFKEMLNEVAEAGECAIDVETVKQDSQLWSVQVSAHEGSAWFIPIGAGTGRVDVAGWNARIIVHHYLHDVRFLGIPEDNFVDTMVQAYLTGQSQGLKELANRLCGVRMATYGEVVHPGQHKLSAAYLNEVKKREWPDSPPTEETKWNNVKGCIVTRQKHPWHIIRKVNKILGDLEDDPTTDLYRRWLDIPAQEREVVESKLGPMPESSLADISLDDAVQYACRDADVTLRVKHKLDRLIDSLGLDFVLKMDTDILPMVDDMMKNGMAVDLDHFRRLSEDYDLRMKVKAAELAGAVGHPFNPNSSPQVATVIYQELGFKPTAYTPSREISTDDAELKKTGSPIATGIIQYRGLLKLKSTYADNMIRSAKPDESGVPRIHTVLTTTRVETGRLSSKKDDNGEGANLQNIPTRNKEAKAIKSGFIAPKGWLMAEGDYSQIEMVTLAHLSGCKRLIELFNRGGDPHTEMAMTIFGVPVDEAAKTKFRYPIKRLNFGIAYLIGPLGLSTQINEYIADLKMDGEVVEIEPWDEPTCEKFIAEWYRLNPEVKDFQMEKAAEARRRGYVQDIFGRIRYIPEVNCPIRSIQEAGCRQATNFSVTSSAQGIIKAAMGELWRELPKTKWANDVHWEMQIHDSLITEVKDDENTYKPALRWMRNVMCGVVKLVVPVKADFKVGKSWASLEKVKLEA